MSKFNDKYISVQLIDDSDDEVEVGFEEDVFASEKTVETVVEKVVIDKEKETKEVKKVSPKKRAKKVTAATDAETVVPECLLKKYYNMEVHIIEIGADEAGRGPMFGRVYSGAVVLPKDDSFDHYKMKDSKKFTSKNSKKINEVAEYIKQNAIAWAVAYEDERVIDEINILQATQSAMHKAIQNVIGQLSKKNAVLDYNNLFLLIDGNYFKPMQMPVTNNKPSFKTSALHYTTIEGGDNKYTSIAAASILAKVERDKYIEELCLHNPDLIEKYGLDSNKGYGSKRHMDGIKKHGISKWHRRTFGICKEYA
jgi:ribonuclease HII